MIVGFRQGLSTLLEGSDMGIAKKDLSKLFKKFFQVNHTKPGSGLGLSICKWLADAHGEGYGARVNWGRVRRFLSRCH